MRFKLAILLTLAASSSVLAQEVSVLAGQLKVNEKDEKTFVGAVSYTHPAGDYFATSITYLNEGHPQDHHRDGIAGQLWLRTRKVQQGWMFGAGAGRYFFFDTATSDRDNGYDNDHGWGKIISAQATYYFDNQWYARVQANRVSPRGKDSATHLLVGAGYTFDGVPGAKLHLGGPSSDDTVVVSAGHTIINSFKSETATPLAIEYRRAVGKYVDWTVTAIKEGSTARADRVGVATQAWMIRSLNSRVELGMGAGPYVVSDSGDSENGGSKARLAGLATIAARYHFADRWVGQFSWNRVVSDYHRDADIFLLGVGKGF